jgi:hypothetical protein
MYESTFMSQNLLLIIPRTLPYFIFLNGVKFFLSSEILLKCKEREIFHSKLLEVLEIKRKLKIRLHFGTYRSIHQIRELYSFYL